MLEEVVSEMSGKRGLREKVGSRGGVRKERRFEPWLKKEMEIGVVGLLLAGKLRF